MFPHFFFFQNKNVESKYNNFFLETYVEKFHKYFCTFHWNPYLRADSANLLILFSGNDFHKKICRNFYVIFLRNVSSNNVCIVLGKTQNAENQKP